MCREISSFNKLVTCVKFKKSAYHVVCKVSLVCWQHGGRCVECLFGCEARDGGQRTSQPHLTSRSVPGLETSEPGRGCDEARLGEAAPIRGRGSKGSPPNTPSSNRIREMTIGNTIWDACLFTRPGNKKRAIETQSLRHPLKIFLTSVFQ